MLLLWVLLLLLLLFEGVVDCWCGQVQSKGGDGVDEYRARIGMNEWYS